MILTEQDFYIGASGWLIEAHYEAYGRHFYYRCRGGEQEVAELDPERVDDFVELDAVCLCEILGGNHDDDIYGRFRVCEMVWSERWQFHKNIFLMGVELLLEGRSAK